MKRMTKGLLIGLFSLVVAVIWFVAKSPISCNRLIDQRLKHAPFYSSNADAMWQWVDNTYNWGRRWLSKETEGDTVITEWRSWDKEYRAFYHAGQQAIRQFWLFPRVTIRDVQRCLGQPETYAWSSAFRVDAFNSQFAMWYQRDGYIFSTGQFYSLEQPVIDLDMPIWTLIVVQPATTPQMAQAAYPARLFGEEIYSDTLSTMTAWPPIFVSVPLTRTDLER
jgi:hypothetical protein